MAIQVLVRLPDELANRLRRHVAPRRRSAFIQGLLENALPGADDDDDPLYRAARAAEHDHALTADMALWDATIGDGLA